MKVIKDILTTYVDMGTAAKIRSEAKAKDWSVSKVIEKILDKHYKNK